MTARSEMSKVVQRGMGCERRAHYGNVEQPFCGLHGGYGVWPCRESELVVSELIAAGYVREKETA